MQVIAVLVFLPQAADKEVPQRIFLFPHHPESCIKKFRQNDKIYRNITFSRRLDLLNGILIEEQ